MAKKDPLSDIRRARFREYCEEQGWRNASGTWSVSTIAEKIGKKTTYVSNILNDNGSFGATAAREIEKALDLPPSYLDGISDDQFIDVPRVDVRVSAGDGAAPHLEDVIGHLKFARSFLRSCGVNTASARVVDVRGNSMEPTIKDGAVLLVSTNNREPTENQIYALARHTEGLIVKRLVRLDGKWLARSDNRDYPDFQIDDGEPVTIIGRALWMGAKL